MARTERINLIQQLQAARKSYLVTYVTSTRPGVDLPMGDDAIRLIYDHLVKKPADAKQVDLFIHSNGGSGTVPWRLVNLIREFAERFEVLIPHRAYSAATLTALGADKIVMHPMGELGPIDPTVHNAFNPRDPANNNQYVGISVEDVLSYFALVKEDIGIRHEDELIHALTAFMQSPPFQVHPLALGNVKRHHSRSRLVAKKLLLTHMQSDDEAKIERIVDNLSSKLFYHGHPISRAEAKADLDLKVENPAANVEKLMWDLFLDYEQEMELRKPFNLSQIYEAAEQAQIAALQAAAQAAAAQAAAVQQGGQPPQPVPPQQPQQQVSPVVLLKGAFIESTGHLDRHETDLRIRKFATMTPAGPQVGFNAEAIRVEWTRSN
jgi:hypothetical protein